MLNNIEIFKRNSKTVKVAAVEGNEDPKNRKAFNLTGFEAVLSVKKDMNSTSYTFQVTGDIPDPESGIILFDITSVLSAKMPGEYFYDVQITNGIKVYTFGVAKMNIKQTVTA